jgi:hypothetical protein
MRCSKIVALAVAATALCLPALGGAAAQNTPTGVYTVGGRTVPGVDTGLVLTTGMSATVTATGAVCPTGGGACPGPDGSAAVDTTRSSYGGFVLPGAPAWGLVGRVGNGPWVQVGSGPTALTGTGSLMFAVNDDLLRDNTGSFTVTVTVSFACFPGWGWGDAKHSHVGPPGLIGVCFPGHGYGDAGHTHAGPPGLADEPTGQGKEGTSSVPDAGEPQKAGPTGPKRNR